MCTRLHKCHSKADSTLRCSRAVPHPSTNRALRRLTSEVGRDPAHSTRYGRRRSVMVHRMFQQFSFPISSTFGRATGSRPAAQPCSPAARQPGNAALLPAWNACGCAMTRNAASCETSLIWPNVQISNKALRLGIGASS